MPVHTRPSALPTIGTSHSTGADRAEVRHSASGTAGAQRIAKALRE